MYILNISEIFTSFTSKFNLSIKKLCVGSSNENRIKFHYIENRTVGLPAVISVTECG